MAAAVKGGGSDGLGRRIRSRRRQLGLAQGAFAARIGVTRNMVIRYEKGRAVPGAAVLARIARESQVTVEWLLGGPDGRGDTAWDEAVKALRAVWPDAEKRRRVLEVLRRVR